jgi:hypothetical protein
MRWRFGDVAARLLAGRNFPSPPPSWACWIEPSPALPIDKVITALKRTNREPRLRSQSELEEQGIVCSYYSTRFAVAVAVDAAAAAADQQRTDMIERWRLHEEAATNAAAEIKIISETLLKSEQRPTPRAPDVESAEVFADYKTIMKFHRDGALERIAAYARQCQQFYQHDRGEASDVWKAVFAADLAFTWRILTGANPARTEPFIRFVTAAYESIGDDLPEVSWERAIRRALALGLDWQHRGSSFDQVRKIFGNF